MLAPILVAVRFGHVGPWPVAAVVFMLAYGAVVASLLDAIGSNTFAISRRIGRGQFDHFLVQPQPLWRILLAPDSGIVRSLGVDPVRDRVRYVGKIGVVFGQRTELWWDHPVAATFAWRKTVWKIPDDVYERSLPFARELLGLDPFWSAAARELSLGQRMRADLALALLGEPRILFLDEPTIGLDALVKQEVLEAIRTLNRERAVTVMITSHDMPDLEQLRARIVLLNEGAIAFDGSFEDLRRRLGDRRRLVLETDSAAAPALPGATHVGSEGMRHQYAFDAAATPIPQLLAAAAARARLVDVETHRAPIEDVVADLYRDWRSA